MKSFDFYAVTYEGEVYCVECLPEGVSVDDQEVFPIFASSEWDHYPVCGVCEAEHDYVGLTREGRRWLASRDVEIGSVISGTMRIEDLVPAFLDELEHLFEERERALRAEYADVIDAIESDDKAQRREAYRSEDAQALLEALFDALDELAPPGTYFGAHWGDAADFGFWPHEDADIDT